MKQSVSHRLLHLAGRVALPHIAFDTGIALAREILAYQGFGCGGSIATSGELSVFGLLAAENPTLFDVGAHVGEYTEAFLAKFPRGRAFAFEPSAAHFGQLQNRIGSNPAVHTFQLALGATAGEAVLYKDADVSGLASLTLRRLDHFGRKMDRQERVTISTVDEVRASVNIDFIDLLKIDVEGNELDVLKGAARAFEDRAIGAIQFEFGGCNLDSRTNIQDFFYFFSDHQYSLHIIKPSGKIHALKKYDEIYEQYRTTNYVALPINERKLRLPQKARANDRADVS